MTSDDFDIYQVYKIFYYVCHHQISPTKGDMGGGKWLSNFDKNVYLGVRTRVHWKFKSWLTDDLSKSVSSPVELVTTEQLLYWNFMAKYWHLIMQHHSTYYRRPPVRGSPPGTHRCLSDTPCSDQYSHPPADHTSQTTALSTKKHN